MLSGFCCAEFEMSMIPHFPEPMGSWRLTVRNNAKFPDHFDIVSRTTVKHITIPLKSNF
jgi:hypothetical protein